MPEIKFNYTVSIGNILTIFRGIVVAVMGIISIETANADRDMKLTSLNERVAKVETIHSDLSNLLE